MTASADPIPSLERYLGSGRVVRLADEEVTLVLEQGSVVRATLALAYPYQPVKGDELLVIGDEAAFWVVGVLKGRGGTRLAEGASSIVAEGGTLGLVGDRGVAIGGPRIAMRAERLGRAALSAIHTFGELARQVREELKVDAEDLDEHSDGRWVVQARRAVVKTLEKVRIESKTVRLG